MASTTQRRRTGAGGSGFDAPPTAEFVAAVSHEFRAALTAIIGCFEMLDSDRVGELSAQQREILVMGSRNADRLVEAVERLDACLARSSSGDSEVS